MRVSELIEELKKHPLDMIVIMDKHSEYIAIRNVLEVDACEPRYDGWIHEARPDKPKKKYIWIGG